MYVKNPTQIPFIFLFTFSDLNTYLKNPGCKEISVIVGRLLIYSS